jgi:hypothetical protein
MCQVEQVLLQTVVYSQLVIHLPSQQAPPGPIHSFLGAAGKFFDYPTLGMDINAVYIGGNMFSTTTANFVGNQWLCNKPGKLDGKSSLYGLYFFRPGIRCSRCGPYTPQELIILMLLQTEGYFIGVDNATFSTLMIRRVSTHRQLYLLFLPIFLLPFQQLLIL